MAAVCINNNCTVADTGTCVLLHAKLSDCPNFRDKPGGELAPIASDPALVVGDEEVGRRFHAGLELGLADATDLMQGRYGTLIAVLGQYDVGKTCLLTSLYLLAACGALLPELGFAGSLTLGGFEARARRLRKWPQGILPTQLVDHTILADPRSPSLMHLALREMDDQNRRYDLLLTDLPGEWTKDLINDVATSDRFKFLGRADGVILTLDGPSFLGPQKHAQVQDTKLLVSRLSETIGLDKSIPLVLLVSKADEIDMVVPPLVEEVRKHADSLGYLAKVIPVSAISRKPQAVPSGTGMRELLEHLLDRNCSLPIEEHAVAPLATRHFMRIGK